VVFEFCPPQGPRAGIRLAATISLNRWTFVAGTLDNATGNMDLYVDGLLAASTNTALRSIGVLTGSAPGLGIGNVQSANYSQYFEGQIDEVRISNVALAPDQFLDAAPPVNNGSTLQPYGISLSGAPGVGIGGVVGSFTDSAPNAKVSNYVATIQWGDGATSAGTIVFNSITGRFDVNGTHTYASAGTYAVAIAVADSVGIGVTIHSGADIVAPVLTPTPSGPASVNEGSSYTLQLSAIDPQSLPVASWLIDWGDGSSAQLPGTATSASHVYDDGPASELISATATDQSGLSGSAVLNVSVQDVAPAGVFSGTAPLAAGQPASVQFSSVHDPSVADTEAGFRYNFDFNNDGVFDVVNSLLPTAIVPANYIAGIGTHIVVGRISDKDGLLTDYTTTITTPAAVVRAVDTINAATQIPPSAFSSSLGAQTGSNGVVTLDAGSWIGFSIDFGSRGVRRARMQLAAASTARGLRIQMRLDQPTGELVASFSARALARHGQVSRASKVTGVHNLYLEVVRGQAAINSFSFVPITTNHGK
jgi:hypothetical protein